MTHGTGQLLQQLEAARTTLMKPFGNNSFLVKFIFRVLFTDQ